MSRLIILITGCRDWSDADGVHRAILEEIEKRGPLTDALIVHGGASGADAAAADFVLSAPPWIRAEAHPADWAKYGRRAGPIRNTAMVGHVVGLMNEPDTEAMCLAFWDGASKGTKDCFSKAERAGIQVRRTMKGAQAA